MRKALMKKFPSEYSNPDDAADHVISELLGFSDEVQFGVHASFDSELKACVGFEETEIQETIQNLVYEINDISIDRITVSKDRDVLLEEFRKNLKSVKMAENLNLDRVDRSPKSNIYSITLEVRRIIKARNRQWPFIG